MKYSIKPISDDIAKNVLNKSLLDKERQPLIDPISIMVIGITINAVLQILIPYIQKRCKERAAHIKASAAKPGIWTKWQVKRSIRKGLEKTKLDLSTYGVTSNDIMEETLKYVANMSEEQIHMVMHSM